MLSKEDLIAIESLLDKKLKTELKPLKIEMRKMEERLIRRIVKQGNLIIDHFDKIVWQHDKRLDRVEDHLHLPPIKFE